ncbi:hypothetical protein ACY0J8_005590, partial [Klebsiella pneumoniae]
MRDPHYAGFFFLVAHCDNAVPQLFAEALVEGKPAGYVPEKRHCSMIKPASAGFLIWKNINLNISMVLAKSAAEGLNISCNRYTVY